MDQTRIEKILDIGKPKTDKAEYLGLILKNQLKVMLISDKQTIWSWASLNCLVGAKDDPDDLPGLSHLCRHMLERGTEKYPRADEFSKKIYGCIKYRVESYLENTSFEFEGDNKFFENCLDRLSQFFLTPLFDQKCIDEEVAKIQKEFEEPFPEVFAYLVDKCTCDQSSIYRKFECGNRKTLDVQNLRSRLLKFFNDYYSANLMSLVLYSNLSLNEMQNIADRMFGSIKNKNLKPVYGICNNSFSKNNLQKLIIIETSSAINLMTINFIIKNPKYTEYEEFIKHFIKFKFFDPALEGSLHSEGSKKGWLNDNAPEITRRHTQYFLSEFLTDNGMENIESVLIESVLLFYQYIEMLKTTNGEELTRHFDCFKHTQDILFDYADSPNTSKEIVFKMHKVPFKSILKPCIIDKFDTKVFRELLNELKPENMRITIESPKLNARANQKERYYNIKYGYEDIPKKWIDSLKKLGTDPNLAMPSINPYIPTDLSLVEREKDIHQIPQLVSTDKFFNVWYFQNLTNMTPKAEVWIHLINPVTSLDPVSKQCMRIYCDLMSASLYEFDKLLWGYYYIIISDEKDGISIKFFGWTHKMLEILEECLTRITSVDLKLPKWIHELENRSKRNKDYECGRFLNWYHNEYTCYIFGESDFSKEEMVGVLNQVTVDRVDQVIQLFKRNLFVQVFAEGNVTKDNVDCIVTLVKSKIMNEHTKPLSPGLIARPKRCLKLKVGIVYVFYWIVKLDPHKELFERHQPVPDENFIHAHFQYKLTESVMESSASKFLHSIMWQFFESEQERKKENKDEELMNITLSHFHILGVEFMLLQASSTTKSFEALDEFIEKSLRDFHEYLIKMSDDDFKASLEYSKSTKFLSGEKTINSHEIVSRRHYFLEEIDSYNALCRIKKSDILDVYNDVFVKNRKKLLLISVTTFNENPNETPVMPKNALPIKDIVRFKKTLEAYAVRRSFTFEEISKKFPSKSSKESSVPTKPGSVKSISSKSLTNKD